IKAGQDAVQIMRDGSHKRFKVTSLMTFTGLGKSEVSEVICGDIAAIGGMDSPSIGETISSVDNPEALPLLDIDEPTIRVFFMVHNSPFAGREGEFKTSRHIQ